MKEIWFLLYGGSSATEKVHEVLIDINEKLGVLFQPQYALKEG